MFWLVLTLAALLLFSYLVLRGENLSYLDQPLPSHPQRPQSQALREAMAPLAEFGSQPMGFGKARVRAIREFMDSMGERREYESEFLPIDNADLRGEWVLAPNSDSRHRILYLHGGAFLAGSPLSHRPITDRLARLTGAAVLVPDYRLMPEHPRIAGIEDCRKAYRWILSQGPKGREELASLVVAGDSAGGNLTLSLLAWVRDEGLTPPNAGVAFSPATDGALDAPSLRANIESDEMLGPAFGRLARLPKLLLLWYTWITTRMFPSDARISPLRGDLSGLPPILVQASDSEMLLDDARRYVAKAQAAESPVVLQTWPDMPHVWQIFTPELPEAEEAYNNVAEFLEGVGAGRSVERAA